MVCTQFPQSDRDANPGEITTRDTNITVFNAKLYVQYVHIPTRIPYNVQKVTLKLQRNAGITTFWELVVISTDLNAKKTEIRCTIYSVFL